MEIVLISWLFLSSLMKSKAFLLGYGHASIIAYIVGRVSIGHNNENELIISDFVVDRLFVDRDRSFPAFMAIFYKHAQSPL